MNILFVHETEYIDKVVFEYQIIPEILASSGHNVYVIDYPTSWKKKNFFDFGSAKFHQVNNVRKSNKAKGITLIRPGIIKIPGVSRLFAFVSYFFLIKKVIKDHNIDRIVLYSVPTNGLQTLYWARKFKIPVHFRLLDVLHRLVPAKILLIPTYLLEKIVYKRVASMTAITPRLTTYAINMGANPSTTTYLPSGSDLDLFYPTGKDLKLLKEMKIDKSDQVVLFAGTLFNFSGLDILIEYLATHEETQKNRKFIIIGRGEQLELLNKLVKRYNLEQIVIITGFVNYLELPKYVNLADVCINPFKINKLTDIIFPGKIYQYMACEKPVIATRLSGVTNIFPDNYGKNNLYYFDIDVPSQFFTILDRVGKNKIKDVNPSLQKIAVDLIDILKTTKQ